MTTDVEGWVDRLKRAAEGGYVLDLADGNTVDRESYATWPAQRTIPAVALLTVLIDPDIRVDSRGIEIRGARFVDCVDLQHRVLSYPLGLRECVLEQGLRLDFAQIRGLYLSRVTVNEGLRAPGVTIQGRLNLAGATLNDNDGVALNLVGAHVTNDVDAVDGFRAHGLIDARGATIGGDLSLTGAVLTKPAIDEARALALDGARISGQVYAGKGADEESRGVQVTGEVSAIDLAVGGSLDLSGAVLNNPDGYALVINRARITSDLFARDGLCATGAVHAIGLTVGGNLEFDGAILNNPATNEGSDGYALVLDQAKITGDVFFRDAVEANGETRSFEATGRVRFRDATIGGDLLLTGATLNCPGTAGKYGWAALDLGGARVAGSVLAGEGAEVKTHPCHVVGTVRAVGATIGYQLDLSGATLTNPDGVALNLEALKVSRLVLTPKKFSGSVNLIRARVDDLFVDEYPPQPLSATGWTIGDVRGPTGSLRENWKLAHRWLDTASADTGLSGRRLWWRTHTAWLRRNKQVVSVQPWHALADVYDRNGDPAAARRLRFAAENKITAQSPPWTRMVRIVYCAVAGYGYFPLLSIASMIVLVAISFAIVHGNRDGIVPTHSDAALKAVIQHLGDQKAKEWLPITAQTPCEVHPGYPCMEPLTYAVNDVLPPAGATNQDWTISPTAPLVLVVGLPVVKLGLWALAALFLAGVSGLLRKSK
ncbi:pentapeptide repeat-containing protein [Mycobacterium sp. Aquia_213]|uniref:pentapeptide repeat-containing protein n=1 Tax=Mycobacterium sp. Aquia_213 TaxID=2991728 RepID=UPI00226F9085|nr:pentapeptide repeat-containing protein [Mycobacterium sp. Aquia_213]WAC93359.1 pentapeptide repeat-containing protein [Mycobacterium sp. Aquia_213]